MTAAVETGTTRLVLGECRTVMREMEERSVDAIVCDPPYGIGFLGESWDQISSFQEWCESWAVEALRLLRPGGHLLAFGSPRTYHRLACGVEDAGFEVINYIEWLYGEGMPKAKGALKPAHEPILLARKGVGKLNIEEARVGTEGGTRRGGSGRENQRFRRWEVATPIEKLDAGRWPANVALGHSVECRASGHRHTLALCPEGCPVRILNEQAPNAGGGFGTVGSSATAGKRQGRMFGKIATGEACGFGDKGGAARFFYISKARERERVGGVLRNLHLTVKPVDLMRWLIRLVTPPGGTILDPFLGSGSTGCAAMVEGFSFVGIEEDAESFQTAAERIAAWAFAHGRENPEIVR